MNILEELFGALLKFMNRIIYILLLSMLLINLEAQQNLVLNGNFEDTLSCPINMGGDIEKARHWTSPLDFNNIHSSDYFNLCSYRYSYVLGNKILPFSGNGFTGILLFNNDPSSDYREYIEGKLSKPLRANSKYCIELVTIPNSKNKYVISNIEVYFSNKLLKSDSTGMVISYKTPQFSNNSGYISDTNQWTLISGSFIAKGGENYFTIGNFQNENSTNYINTGWFDGGSYYFFDDIKVYYCGPDTTPETELLDLEIPNVFTPNFDGYNDQFEYGNQEQWEFETQIFNRWGELVFNNTVSQNWDGFYNGNKVSTGVYFYVIKAMAIKTGEVRVYNGTVSVLYQ